MTKTYSTQIGGGIFCDLLKNGDESHGMESVKESPTKQTKFEEPCENMWKSLKKGD